MKLKNINVNEIEDGIVVRCEEIAEPTCGPMEDCFAREMASKLSYRIWSALSGKDTHYTDGVSLGSDIVDLLVNTGDMIVEPCNDFGVLNVDLMIDVSDIPMRLDRMFFG